MQTRCARAIHEELLRAITGSQQIVYHGAGHALHWEQPARCAADPAAFARALPERPARRADHAIAAPAF